MLSIKHTSKLAAYAILRDKDGRVLFMRRNNTGYMDGKLGLPSGHVERNETFVDATIRELEEEVGVTASKNQIKHALTLLASS